MAANVLVGEGALMDVWDDDSVELEAFRKFDIDEHDTLLRQSSVCIEHFERTAVKELGKLLCPRAAVCYERGQAVLLACFNDGCSKRQKPPVSDRQAEAS